MGILIHGHCTIRDDGNKGTPEYIAYFAMKNRCLNKKQARYKDYGERGITICDRWLNGENGLTGFECFLADMGGKPTKNHTLERKDNDLGYSPDNCRWATMKEQSRNTRQTRWYDVGFGPMSMVECIELYGHASDQTIRMRLHRGWHPDDAIFTPVGEDTITDRPVPF